MATPNIVPRANNEGQLGTDTKRWSDGNFQQLHVSGLNIVNNGALQAETVNYQARIIAASGSLDYSTLSAVDNLVVQGKQDGWWTLTKEFYLFLGTNAASQAVKLKYAASGSLVLTNFTDADCSDPRVGFGTDANNTTKYAMTSFIPSNYGLTGNNISLAVSFLSRNVGVSNNDFGRVVGTNPVTTYPPDFECDDLRFGVGADNLVPPFGQLGVRMFSYGASNRSVWLDRSLRQTVTGTVSASLNTEVSLFRTLANSTTYWARGRIGAVVIGGSMTAAQAVSLQNAIAIFERAIGRRNDKPVVVTFGDSITAGSGVTANQTHYSYLLSCGLGLNERNMGQGSSLLYTDSSSPQFVSGLARYADILLYDPAMVFILYGTNDIAAGISTANFSTALTTVVNGLITGVKGKGISANNIVIGSIPYRTPGGSYTLAQQMAYAEAARSVAKTAGVRFADIWGALYAATVSGTTVLADGTHPNTAGHALVAKTFLEAADAIPKNVIGISRGVNLNATVNSDIPIAMFASKYVIQQIILANPSADISTSATAAAVRDSAAGAGNAVVSTVSFSNLSGQTKFNSQTLFASAGTDVQTANPLYFRVGATNHGSVATVDAYVIGTILAQ